METIIYRNRITAAAFAAIALPFLVLGFILGHVTTKKYTPEAVTVQVVQDSTVYIDTVQAVIPAPNPNEGKPVKTVRIEIKSDTTAKPDTAFKPQALPQIPLDTFKTSEGIRLTPQGIDVDIEEKVYQTDQYRATIQGWRPELVGMEVYPKTKIITEVQTRTVTRVRRPWFTVVAGPGVSYTGDQIVPTVGVTAGLDLSRLWSK